MKKNWYFNLVIALLLTSCASTEKEAMKGEPVEGSMKAYEEMCARTPDSILCKRKDPEQ